MCRHIIFRPLCDLAGSDDLLVVSNVRAILCRAGDIVHRATLLTSRDDKSGLEPREAFEDFVRLLRCDVCTLLVGDTLDVSEKVAGEGVGASFFHSFGAFFHTVGKHRKVGLNVRSMG